MPRVNKQAARFASRVSVPVRRSAERHYAHGIRLVYGANVAVRMWREHAAPHSARRGAVAERLAAETLLALAAIAAEPGSTDQDYFTLMLALRSGREHGNVSSPPAFAAPDKADAFLLVYAPDDADALPEALRRANLRTIGCGVWCRVFARRSDAYRAAHLLPGDDFIVVDLSVPQ